MLPASTMLKVRQVIAVCLVCLGPWVVTAQAQIQVAGDLFVDLRAADFDPATGVWSQSASCTTCLDGFTAVGDPLKVTSAEGITAVEFDGSGDYFDGPPAAPGLVGPSPTRSIEVWAFNPSIASEETLVSWGRRGGPDGTNMAFNYGNHELFGAVGHWGGGTADKGWNDDDATVGAPAAGEWHHLAYTFDGTTTRVYSDGELVGTEDVLAAHGITLDTHAVDTGGNPLPIRIASQNDDSGAATSNLRGSLSIGQVRIHDGVLDDIEILTNYVVEQPNYVPEPGMFIMLLFALSALMMRWDKRRRDA